MELFDFYERFNAARTFAVVGNAPTVLDYENGDQIDSHDIVVRFNRAYTTGHEAKIGSRTDILVVNTGNSLKLAPSPSSTLRPQCVVCFVSPKAIPKVDVASLREWVGDVPFLVTCGPDPFGLPALFRTRELTSGSYLLFTLLSMFTVERLFVTGFTMFNSKNGGDRKYYADNRPGLGGYHDLDQESRLFAAILASCPPDTVLTDEVKWLIGQGTWSNALTSNSLFVRTRRLLAGALSWRSLQLGLWLRRMQEL